MAVIVRDPRFSMSIVPPVERKSAAPTMPSLGRQTPSPTPRRSYAKRLERRVTNLWKLFTNTRGRQRASVYSNTFIDVTTRRRSTLAPVIRINA